MNSVNDDQIDKKLKSTSRISYVPNGKKYSGISASRVTNKDYLNTLGDLFKCNICFNIMNNPTDCEKCGHSYCLDCITNFKCPFECESAKVKASSMAIKLLLNQLVFNCENEGCHEQLFYSDINLHDQDCEYKPTKCPSPNCGINVSKLKLEQHIKEECNYSLRNCKFCHNEFYLIDLKEHQENCEYVLNSFSSNGALNKKYNNGNGTKYIEALNINISKIIKEQESKYKILEDENKNIKSNLNENIQNLVEKLKTEIKDCKGDASLTDMKTKLSEDLKNDLSENLIKNIGPLILNSKDNIISYFDNLKIKSKLDELEILIKNDQNVNKDEAIKGLEAQINEFNKFFITIKEQNINILNNLKDLTNSLVEFKKNSFVSENKVEDLNYIQVSKELENIKEKITELFSKLDFTIKSEKKVDFDIDIDTILSNHFKNLIEVIENKNLVLNENIIKELKELKINKENNEIKNVAKEESIKENVKFEAVNEVKEKEEVALIINKLTEEFQNIKDDLEMSRSKTKEVTKILNEEFAEVNSKIEETNTKIDKFKLFEPKCTCEEKFKTFELSILAKLDNLKTNKERVLVEPIKLVESTPTIKIIDATPTKILLENPGRDSLTNNTLEIKLKDLESRLVISYENKLKEMYNLKWCNECEKVDYFFGFIKCDICIKETCKGCVLLCKTCKHLYCRKCVECPKCKEGSCINCRINCSFCSQIKGQK